MVEDGVVFADENVSKDPKGSSWFGNVHSGESRDARFLSTFFHLKIHQKFVKKLHQLEELRTAYLLNCISTYLDDVVLAFKGEDLATESELNNGKIVDSVAVNHVFFSERNFGGSNGSVDGLDFVRRSNQQAGTGVYDGLASILADGL